jgi:hypothetical protein
MTRARRAGAALGASLACSMLLLALAQATPVVSCKPILTTRATSDTRASPIEPYLWKASMVADSRHCATRTGAFEVDFIRIKEYAPDLQFTEKYRWTTGEFEIVLDLSGDEAVLDHRVGFVAPCVCRDLPFG